MHALSREIFFGTELLSATPIPNEGKGYPQVKERFCQITMRNREHC